MRRGDPLRVTVAARTAGKTIDGGCPSRCITVTAIGAVMIAAGSGLRLALGAAKR